MDQVGIEPLNDDFSSSFPFACYADVLDSHSQMVVITLWIGCLFLNDNWPFYSLRLVPACLITSIAYAISFLIKNMDLPQYQNMRISSGVLIVGITIWLTWESLAELVAEFCLYIIDDERASNAQNESLPQQEEILEEQQLSRAEELSNSNKENIPLGETITIQQTQQRQPADIFNSTYKEQLNPVLEETIQFSERLQEQRDEVHASTYVAEDGLSIIEETLIVDQTMVSTENKLRSRKHGSGTKSKEIQHVSPTREDKSLLSQQTTSISISTTSNDPSLHLGTFYAEGTALNGELNNTSLLKQETSSMKQKRSPVAEKTTCEVQVLKAESLERTLESSMKPLKKRLKKPVLPTISPTTLKQFELLTSPKAQEPIKRQSRKSN